jgi:Transglutaminase-like superfamily
VTRYFLPHSVYLCYTDDAAVFLDARRPGYFGVPGAQIPVLASLLDDSEAPTETPARTESPSSLAEALLSKGLLTTVLESGRGARTLRLDPIELALADTYETHSARSSWHDVLNALYACVSAHLQLRFSAFNRMLLRVQERKERGSRTLPGVDIRELARIFMQLQPFLYTGDRKCLFESLALINFLSLYGAYPTLVIGVTAKPFSAHCWVQDRECTLNGTSELSRRFTPLVAI